MQRLFFLLLIVGFFSCSTDQPSDTQFQPIVKPSPISLPENTSFKIGVIGSGIGGASFVHFINQAATEHCQITVYEKEDRIGGRVKKDILGGGMIEQGATLIHSSNFYLQDIMDTRRYFF